MDQVKFDILINATPAQKALNKFANTVTKVVSKVDRQLSGLDKHLGSVSKSLTVLNGKSLKGFNKGITTANKNLASLEKRMKNIGTMSGGAKGGAKGGGNRFVSGAMGLVGGYAAYSGLGAIKDLFGSGAQFNSTMSRVQSLTSANASEFDNLKSSVIDAGKASTFTMNQMASASQFMGMAGMTPSQITNMMPSVANLGMAGGLDAGKSADILTNIMTSSGINTSQGGAVTDVLSTVMTGSNVTMENLGNSFKYVGSIANQAGVGIKDLSAALGAMGDAGIQGSTAGTQLRQVMLKLAKPTKEGAKALKRLGIDYLSADGKSLKPFTDLIKEFKGASLEDMATIFGARGATGFGALVKNSDKFEKLLIAMQDGKGKTKELAQKHMNTLVGKTEMVKTKWEALGVALSDTVEPVFMLILDKVGRFLDKLTASKTAMTLIKGVAIAFLAVLQGIYDIGKFIWDNKAIIAVGVAIAGVAAICLGWEAIMIGIESAFAAIVGSALFIPVLIGAAVAAIMILWDKMDTFRGGVVALGMEIGTFFMTAFKPILDIMHTAVEVYQKISKGDWSGAGLAAAKGMASMAVLPADMVRSGLAAVGGAGSEWDKNYEKGKNNDFRFQDFIKDGAKSLSSTLGIDLDKVLGFFGTPTSDVSKSGGTIEDIIQGKGNLTAAGSGTQEGDAVDTLAKASPLTSSRNEMSRSVVVNMNSLVENVNIGGALGSNETSSQIEEEVAQIFTKVVRDWELGMSK